MNKTEFEKDLEIDLENLEVEATLQPELYFKYSLLTKEACERRDLLKLKLSVVEAELARKVRLTPAKFKVKKVTDSSIKEAVGVHPRYKIASKKLIKAKWEADLLYSAQNSMEHRKRMIELLVMLHGREYFSGPSTPHNPKHFWDQIKKKRGEKTHEKMIAKARKRKRAKRE